VAEGRSGMGLGIPIFFWGGPFLRATTHFEKGSTTHAYGWLMWALVQSVCLYSLFFEHYNRNLLFNWVLGRYSVCLRACTWHNTFTLPDLDPGWTQCPTLNVVLYQVLRVSEQKSKESVCNLVVQLQNLLLTVLFCLFYQSAFCRQCAFAQNL